jgi:hypothetical protein
MRRRGNPYDIARAKRFMRTLKEEEVYGKAYQNLEDARSRIGEFLEQVYEIRSPLGDDLKTGHLRRFRLDCFTPRRSMSARWGRGVPVCLSCDAPRLACYGGTHFAGVAPCEVIQSRGHGAGSEGIGILG